MNKEKKPNIIFVFSDQQRWDTCGCYGQKLDTTPNLDKMAAEGVKFENAFTCQPVCGPARACLQTGKYATELDCFTNGRPLPLNEVTLANKMSDSGYEVGYIGKWHLAADRANNISFRDTPVPPERRGGYKDFWLATDALEHTSHGYGGYMFDADMNKREFPEGRFRADVLTDWTLDYLQSRTQEKPFFLFLSFIEPHHQNDREHYEGPNGSREKFKDYEHPGDLIGTGGDWRGEYPDYLGCVNSLDNNLGRIRKQIEEMGLSEDTLIIYTSDHGTHFRTRNAEYKRSCHEGCIRIPMIACGPGFKGGKVVNELVSLIDLPPTVLDAAESDIPGSMRGKPLQQLANGSAKDWPDEVFLQISEAQVGRAIRTKKWKYAIWATNLETLNVPGSDVYDEAFLYDLENDYHERNNLIKAPGYASVRAELCETIKRRMAEAGEEIPEIRPAQ